MTSADRPGRLFGTDGVRGLANRDLTPELALAVAHAVVRELASTPRSGARPLVVVGRDPRASGEMLEAAVVAGVTSAGADVLLTGVVPTPAVAFLVAETGADCGIVLSASHNPMPDNGVKVFGPGGHKLSDDVEDAVAARCAKPPSGRPTGAAIGRVRELADAGDRYVAHLLASCPTPLAGLRVVVDCSHGSASAFAPRVYAAAGADVVAIGAEPDGLNINDGVGSTHPQRVQDAVRAHGADVGIAHDGDADRALAVDAHGELVDGDQIMGVLAVAMADAGTLARRTLVTTVMSNLGLHLAMRAHDIDVRTTPVGDRYVLAELRRDGLSLGGEQSGHVVLPEHASTGDGLLTALSLLGCVARSERPLAGLAAVVQRLPQVLVNVTVADKAAVAASSEVAAEVAGAARQLGDTGRVLLRPSGTESLVRVMVEAPTHDEADEVATRLAQVVGATG